MTTQNTRPGVTRPDLARPVEEEHGPDPSLPPRSAVSVDGSHCQLYGICEQEAPGVFELGVDGRLRYDPRPAAQQTAAVRQAARCCPMQAITVADRR